MSFNILLSLWISLLCTYLFHFVGLLDPSLDYSSLILQSTVIGPILILLGIWSWTLTRYPHILKYFKLDFLSFHFSYGKDCILIKQNRFLSKRTKLFVDPFCSKDSSSTQVLCKPELINNVSIISFNVRFFIRLRWIWL